MNRLDQEFQRLFLSDPADGRVRALSLAVHGPSAWDALSAAWQGVQADLQWPPPAIAIDGAQGYQLWFALQLPLPQADALAVLEGLRARYLAGVQPARVALQASAAGLPPAEITPGHWSAFIAPDLAAIFADEPWLDIPPGPDAQAELLARVKVLAPADLQRLDAGPAPRGPGAGASTPAPAPGHTQQDARSFLLAVMNDPAVPLPLRIEAAKALLAAA